MKFALTHDAEGSPRNSVDRDIERDTTLAFRSGELHAPKRHVALLTKVFPRGHCLVCNRREPFAPNVRRRLSAMSPALRRGICSAAWRARGADWIHSDNAVEWRTVSRRRSQPSVMSDQAIAVRQVMRSRWGESRH